MANRICPNRVTIFKLLILVGIIYAPGAYAGIWGAENWGEMLWGTNTQIFPVPAMPVFGMLLLAAALLFITRRYGAKRVAPFVLVLLMPLVAISVPNTFVNGTVADADEVNANFAALEASVLTTTIRSCAAGSPFSDCTCPTGEVVTGGGTFVLSNSNVTIRESRPLTPSMWRVTCAQLVAGQIGMDVTCPRPIDIVCLEQ